MSRARPSPSTDGLGAREWGRASRSGRRARFSLSLLFVAVCSSIVVLLTASCGDALDPSAGDHGSSVTPGPEAVAVSLVRVVDGDTIIVRMPDGSDERLRYIGLDAPESVQPGAEVEYLGLEASAHNLKLLASGPLRIRFDQEERDQHGRLLAYVWAGDVFVNEQLVRDGFAEEREYPPNVSLQDVLRAAEKAARAAGQGIWSPDATASLRPGRVL